MLLFADLGSERQCVRGRRSRLLVFLQNRASRVSRSTDERTDASDHWTEVNSSMMIMQGGLAADPTIFPR